MSTAAVARIDFRAFSGYREPGLPAGHWFGQSVVQGDGSGGRSQAQLLFQLASNAYSARLWSLEEFAINPGPASAGNAAIRTLSMDSRVPGDASEQLNERVYVFPLLADPLATTLGISPDLARPAIFLGAPAGPDLACGIVADVINPGLAAGMTFNAQGYWWDPGARLADGGIRRPNPGLWI